MHDVVAAPYVSVSSVYSRHVVNPKVFPAHVESHAFLNRRLIVNFFVPSFSRISQFNEVDILVVRIWIDDHVDEWHGGMFCFELVIRGRQPLIQTRFIPKFLSTAYPCLISLSNFMMLQGTSYSSVSRHCNPRCSPSFLPIIHFLPRTSLRHCPEPQIMLRLLDS